MKKLKEMSKLWWVLIASGLIYATIGLAFCDQKWINSLLQIGAIILSILFTLILNVENNLRMAEQTQKQIDSISASTDKQIDEIRQATEKEIEAVRLLTDKQIENYRLETQKVVAEMKTSSDLLAGILQRQLENAILDTNKELDRAKAIYDNISGFKLLRTQEEKERQLRQQKTFIDRIGERLVFFKKQYDKVLNYVKGN